MTRTRTPSASSLTGPAFSDMAQTQVLLFVIVPAIVGLAFSSFVLLAPIFGRMRTGLPYAVLGFCSSAALLPLALVLQHESRVAIGIGGLCVPEHSFDALKFRRRQMDFLAVMMIYLGLATLGLAVGFSIKAGCKEIADSIREKSEASK